MEERNDKMDISPEVKVKIPTSKRLENYWYHYKWHTIVGILVIGILTVLLVQCKNKTEYDVNIVYAGEKVISTSSATGDGITELSLITKAIESVAKDYNEDGKVRFSLRNLHILSLAELNAEKEKIDDPTQRAALESSVQSARQELRDVFYNDNYVYLLSEDVFREWDTSSDDTVFVNIGSYAKDGAEYDYASERGIYISSLPIYASSDLSLLPPDTVLCLRMPGVLKSKNSDKAYEAAEDLIRSLLAFGN